MKTDLSQLTLPPAPNLIGSLRSGFDTVANHITVILLPLVLDLLLWFGPRLQLTTILKSYINQIVQLYKLADPGSTDLLKPIQDTWLQIAERFNLLVTLRSYPIGVPSLMVSALPNINPVGQSFSFEVTSIGIAFLLVLAFTLLGLVIGTFYFALISQVAVSGKIDLRLAFKDWPWASGQVIGLAALSFLFLLLISLPASFLLSFMAVGGLALGQCAFLVYAGFAVWLILPLFFSPHGIFVYRYPIFRSIKASATIIRRTLPTATLFLLVIFLLNKGLDLLWLIPAENSWLLLIGILGHAFVTTGLLAASFYFYLDADRWVRSLIQLGKIAS